MIWKVASGLLAAMLLIGAWLYIPDLRFWNKQTNQANKEQADSIRSLRTQLAKVQKSSDDKAATIAQVQRDMQLSDAGQAAVVPTITVQVQGLSALAQRTANLEELVKAGLVTPKDTSTKTGEMVCYSLPVNTAMTIRLRYADTLTSQLFYTKRANYLLHEAYRQRGDSVKKVKVWIDDGEKIASKKGWFTGRNRELRQHAKAPPI